MLEEASLNDPMPSICWKKPASTTQYRQYVGRSQPQRPNITLPSLPVPDTGPTDKEDKVKNLLEATRPLTELNASLSLMAKEINPCWVTKIKFLPDIYLRGGGGGGETKGTESTGKPGNWPPMHLTNTRRKAWPSLEKKSKLRKGQWTQH